MRQSLEVCESPNTLRSGIWHRELGCSTSESVSAYTCNMTLDKREAVFVSSTYVDLVTERQEVIQTLLEADCIPSGMELFPSSDDDRWTLIKRVIDDCDYYIVVIGGRYGTIDGDQGLSYTEMEFDYATERQIPIMGFLHSDPMSIEAGKTDLDPQAREMLEAFRKKVGQRMVKQWSSAHELGGSVAKSLIQIRKTHPAEGWIRARNALTPELEQEIAQLREKVSELSLELEKQRTNSGIGFDQLAQGLDPYEYMGLMRYYTLDDTRGGRTWGSNTKQYRFTVEATWDEIFSYLGAFMIDEASMSTLDKEFNNFTTSKWSVNMNYPDDYGQANIIGARGADFQNVIVQLFSLGLIERSEKRRSVSDTNAYWKLTSAGQNHLMRLRALRRSPVEDAPEDEESLQIDK